MKRQEGDSMRKLLISKKDFFMILLGVTVLSIGINWFTAPLNLITGGVSGVTIIVKNLSEQYLGFGIPLSVTTFVLNLPLFIISIKQRGFEFAKKSAWAVGLLTIALWYTELIPNILDVQGDLVLGGIFSGIIIGLGVGIVLRAGATTGGTDMLATIIRYKNDSVPIAKVMLIIDSVIILAGLLIFGPIKAMYAIVSVYISSKVINAVLEGMHYAKAAFIISDKNEEIASAILSEVNRGATGIKAKGMYTKKDKDMLYVVVSQKEISLLRETVRSIDPKAFVTIADVREVLGEGFIEDYNSIA